MHKKARAPLLSGIVPANCQKVLGKILPAQEFFRRTLDVKNPLFSGLRILAINLSLFLQDQIVRLYEPGEMHAWVLCHNETLLKHALKVGKTDVVSCACIPELAVRDFNISDVE